MPLLPSEWLEIAVANNHLFALIMEKMYGIEILKFDENHGTSLSI